MRLEAYLDRIGYRHAVRPDHKTFAGIHRAHSLAIPYENLDVQLRLPLTRSAGAAFDKIVGRRRGGWCYEMNGLLAAALDSIGFNVRRLAAAVMRDEQGDAMIGNHLVMIVTLGDDQYLADTGFGDGPIEPLPLVAGEFQNGPFACSLARLDGGWWRYANDPRTGGPTFDFNPDVAGEDQLERLCNHLQTDPASPFVQNAVVQRWQSDQHCSMRGRVLRVLSAKTEERSLIASAADYVATLKSVFDIDLPEAATLWPAILARHEEVFGQDGATP